MKIMSSTQYKPDVTIVIGRLPEIKKLQFFTEDYLIVWEKREGGEGRGIKGGDKREKSRRETQTILL